MQLCNTVTYTQSWTTKVNNLHTGKQTDLIILDFSKAFDKVPHKKLLRKLDNYGTGVSKWAGTFTRLRSCIVPAEITEPPKISGGQNHKYDGW